jgi:hypothetical protein
MVETTITSGTLPGLPATAGREKKNRIVTIEVKRNFLVVMLVLQAQKPSAVVSSASSGIDEQLLRFSLLGGFRQKAMS